jgi:predicted permease
MSVDEEVDAELDFHVAMRIHEYVARGLDPKAARQAAMSKFGDLGSTMTRCRELGYQREREMQRHEYLSELTQDIRLAMRQLRRLPVFGCVAVSILAIGIGTTTAIFSAAEAVVLRPLPYAHADRLAIVFDRWHDVDGNVAAGNYAEWQRRSTSFDQLAAADFGNMTVASGDSPERVVGAQVTANFFTTLGVRPAVGRVFTAAEDHPNPNVAVLSDGLWRRDFGGDRDAVGKTIRLNGASYLIVGIMPAGFDPTSSGEELWTPAGFTGEQLTDRDNHHYVVVGLLKPGATIDRAQSELTSIARDMEKEYPQTNTGYAVHVRSQKDVIVGDNRTWLFLLLGAVGSVLLIACGNVATLLLARGASRAKEFAIRTAIGAGRGRIIRQLMTENLVLGAAAAVLGVGVAWAGVRLLVAAAPAGIPRLEMTRIDGTALGFALTIAMICSVIFGLVPALRAGSTELHGVIKEGTRTAMASTRDRARTVLVGIEIAVALMLLVGAGLLIRSAIYVARINPGFEMDGLFTARVALGMPAQGDGTADAEQTFDRIVTELKSRPEIAAVALTSQAPLGFAGTSNGLVPEGRPRTIANAIQSQLRMVTPGYLAAMRIPLVAGRDISDIDVPGALRVIVVSEALARKAWPNESAIGKRIACCEGTDADPRWKTVVGVAADVHSNGPTQDVGPEFYLPMAQAPSDAWMWVSRAMTVVARARHGDGAALAPIIRAAVKDADPAAPVYQAATMKEQLRANLAATRFTLILLTVLGGAGLLLAITGVYSVIAYFVSLRTPEVAVRMALGATAFDVVALLSRQGAGAIIGGLVAGAMASLWVTQFLQSFLVGVRPRDPMTMVASIGVVALVAGAATVIPARRATGVNPATALHG